jgi:hypothetical protein
MKRTSSEHARRWQVIAAEAAALRERGVLLFMPGEAFGAASGGVNVQAMGQASVLDRCEAIQREYEKRCADGASPQGTAR